MACEPELDRLTRDEKEVHLEPRVMSVLVYLAENAGRVVGKDELLREVWQGTFVEEIAVARSVSDLRRALGDDTQHPTFIETIPKRGYRLLAPVTAPSPDHVSTPAPEHVRRRFALALSAILIACAGAVLVILLRREAPRVGETAPRIRSLAVIPLRTLSNRSEEKYFADGMTDALTSDLAQIHALRVVSGASLLRQNDRKATVGEIVRKLSVDALLEGSVMRSGDDVRLTLSLVEPGGSVRWSRTYLRPLRDVFSLQGDVARDVADNVQALVEPRVAARLARSRPVDTEAYIDYLKGRAAWQTRDRAGFALARQLLTKAIARDPDFAPAHASLAISRVLEANHSLASPEEAFGQAKREAIRAIALDPRLAEAHAALAGVLGSFEWDVDGANREARLMVDLEPSNATYRMWNAQALTVSGRLEDAIAEADAALKLDPLSAWVQSCFAELLRFAGDDDRALRLWDAAAALSPPKRLEARYFEGLILATEGKEKEAIDAFARSHPEDAKMLFADFASAGFDEAMRRKQQRELDRIFAAGGRNDRSQTAVIAQYYVLAGNLNEAIRWLERARKERSADLPSTLASIAFDPWPLAQPVKDDPRFDRLLQQVGSPPMQAYRDAAKRTRLRYSPAQR